jgi:hypothetical protein
MPLPDCLTQVLHARGGVERGADSVADSPETGCSLAGQVYGIARLIRRAVRDGWLVTSPARLRLMSCPA